jgi:hypothetical protein
MLQYLTHIEELIYHFIITLDINTPQRSFDNIEGADVAYLEIVLLTKPLPTPQKYVAAPASPTTHLPRCISTPCDLECYCARFLQPNRITESSCQSLQ